MRQACPASHRSGEPRPWFAARDRSSCFGWVASIREAIAAAAMENIKTTISQALQLQALQAPQHL
eukprot:5092997-Prymnesium_polylepis.2